MTNNVFQYMLLCFFPETLILPMKILNSFQFVEFTIYYQYVLYFMFLKLSFINVMVSCKDYDSENVKTTSRLPQQILAVFSMLHNSSQKATRI